MRDNYNLHLVQQQAWKGVFVNDKKAVYRCIVSSEVNVNCTFSGQAFESTSLKPAKIRQFWLSKKVFESLSNFTFAGNSREKHSSSYINPFDKNEDQLIEDFPEGCSLLHLACITADVGMVELLLQYGANINVSDAKGQTPLHYCAMRGKSGIAKMLIMRCVFAFL